MFPFCERLRDQGDPVLGSGWDRGMSAQVGNKGIQVDLAGGEEVVDRERPFLGLFFIKSSTEKRTLTFFKSVLK